jgi:hypothetical protein
MIKIEDSELEKEITSLYESGVKKRKIARLLGISTSYIDRVVLEKGKPKRVFVPDQGFMIVAKCKKTGKNFEDYENKSGAITLHVIELHPEFVIPTPFKRRKFFKENNRFWYEDFFDIIQVKKELVNYKKCKYCDWTTVDIENKSGWYTTHLLKAHEKSLENYVLEFPEEKLLFKTHFIKKEKKDEMLSSEKNFIACVLCGQKMSKITNTHLKKSHGITLFEYRMMNQNTLSDSSLAKFKNMYETNLKDIPNKFISKPQESIMEFIREMGFDVEGNNKSMLEGTEVDILVREKNFAIEFDGLYYHSEISGKKTRRYHEQKTILAESKGMRLIHIFEDEWQNKPNIVKSKIRHLLGKGPSNRIHARKTTVKEITRQERDVFLERNHIQGTDNSNITLGAFHGERLCAVMTFDNIRQMNKGTAHTEGTYELKRFATDIEIVVSGIASKILKFFIKKYHPDRIISFADLRWTSQKDNLYLKTGFSFERRIPPDYNYTFYKSGVAYRFHKFGYGKSSIKKKFPDVYSSEKTEWEMMQEKGFDRIWDCGKLRYVIEF